MYLTTYAAGLLETNQNFSHLYKFWQLRIIPVFCSHQSNLNSKSARLSTNMCPSYLDYPKQLQTVTKCLELWFTCYFPFILSEKKC